MAALLNIMPSSRCFITGRKASSMWVEYEILIVAHTYSLAHYSAVGSLFHY
jgi:DNA-directed RNA polymerase subunit N (RpoN/RPB10)